MLHGLIEYHLEREVKLKCDLKSERKSVDPQPWDEYFMSMALVAASRTTICKLQVGAVLTKDNRVLSTGYNGYFPKAQHEPIFEGSSDAAVVHAEQNAILFAAQSTITLIGATCYTTHHPCVQCTKLLIAAGICRIVYLFNYKGYADHSVVVALLKRAKVKATRLASLPPREPRELQEPREPREPRESRESYEYAQQLEQKLEKTPPPPISFLPLPFYALLFLLVLYVISLA